MSALANRLVAQDRWLLLVDAALANRALDPVLPRLLQRDPERLLDRLTLLLTEPLPRTAVRGNEFGCKRFAFCNPSMSCAALCRASTPWGHRKL